MRLVIYSVAFSAINLGACRTQNLSTGLQEVSEIAASGDAWTGSETANLRTKMLKLFGKEDRLMSPGNAVYRVSARGNSIQCSTGGSRAPSPNGPACKVARWDELRAAKGDDSLQSILRLRMAALALKESAAATPRTVVQLQSGAQTEDVLAIVDDQSGYAFACSKKNDGIEGNISYYCELRETENSSTGMKVLMGGGDSLAGHLYGFLNTFSSARVPGTNNQVQLEGSNGSLTCDKIQVSNTGRNKNEFHCAISETMFAEEGDPDSLQQHLYSLLKQSRSKKVLHGDDVHSISNKAKSEAIECREQGGQAISAQVYLCSHNELKFAN